MNKVIMRCIDDIRLPFALLFNVSYTFIDKLGMFVHLGDNLI